MLLDDDGDGWMLQATLYFFSSIMAYKKIVDIYKCKSYRYELLHFTYTSTVCNNNNNNNNLTCIGRRAIYY